MRNPPDVIAWHAAQLLERHAGELPLIAARKDNDSGAVRFFVCAPDSEKLLCDVTAGFDRLNMNIVDARVHRMRSNLVIMVFVVLPGVQGTPSAADLEAAAKRLRHEVRAPPTQPPGLPVHIPRTVT